MNKMDEQIIVVPRAALFEDERLAFQGTLQQPERVATIEHNLAGHYELMRRGDAEEDPAYKQPIPYAVIRRGENYFAYRRLSGGAESRLHGKLSIGVGGHMNRVEASHFADVLHMNLQREISEELIINEAGAEMLFQTIGLVNDDEGEVGRVHVGLLVLIDLPVTASVSVREADKLSGRWMTIGELRRPDIYDRLESWSALAVDALTAG
ncbi:MAG: hypothetical protein ABF868_01290 [Sporolactobacillus sp.]